MKNANLKKIIVTVLTLVVVLSTIFVLSSCQHSHTLVETVVTPATCDSNGVLEIKCSDEKCDYVESKVIPATGHDNETKVTKTPTCIEDGALKIECSRCGNVENQKIAAPGHKEKKVAAKAPTCTTEGYMEHVKCELCDWTTLTADMIIAPLGHIPSNWLDDRDYTSLANGKDRSSEYPIVYPTCTEPGSHYNYKECVREFKNSNGTVSSVCGENLEYVLVEDAPLGHDITNVDHQAANCCPGHDAYEYCNGWSRSELASLGYPNMPAISSSGPSLGMGGCGYNTYVEHPPVYDHVMTSELEYKETRAATCESEGAYQLIRRCTTPGCSYSVVEETGVISVLGHEWQSHRGQDATCSVDGWKDFIMCSRCDKIDTPDGKVPVIPAGHKYDDDGCLLVCTACGYINESNGGHQLITKVSDEEGARQNPTCVDAGFYTCIKWCEKCQKAITTEVVRIDPHGHDYISYAGKTPTCTTVGWDAFKACSRCDYSEFVEIPAYGHTIDYSSLVVRTVTEATCTYEGYEKHVYYCSVCNEAALEEYHATPMVSHTVVNVPELLPECDAAGHNAYSYCSECGKSIVDMVTYPALGHIINNVPAQDPTCTEIGWYSYSECTRPGCGYNNRTESLRAATGHNIVNVDAKSPTCTEDGWYAYTICATCGGESTMVTRPATGHIHGTWVEENVVYSTCTDNGSYDYVKYCDACGEKIDALLNQVIYAYNHNYNEVTGKCTNVNENDGSACPAYYTPCLSFALKEDRTMAVTGMHVNTSYTEIIIPETFRGYTVTSINYEAFYNTDIVSVVIPDSVTHIDASAFYNCDKLTTVTIGSGVVSIGRSAFYNCKSLTTVYYHGTAEEWNKIYIASTQNDKLTSAKRVYN